MKRTVLDTILSHSTIPAEEAEEVISGADNLRGLINHCTYSLSTLLSIVVADEAKPSEELVSDCNYAVALLSCVASTLQVLESDARQAQEGPVSQ
ncbi:MAG: hypothetical protein KME67_10865 [Candidatus Thiodiazotropha sp. (ex Codakia orbicularis)]|nr:hypothetical protein [Candidatus Thiodiazotropha sp. (ex Codakia orbicularis)]